MTIKIEIPSGNEFKPLAAAIGLALYNFGNDITAEKQAPVVTTSVVTEEAGKVQRATAGTVESSTTEQDTTNNTDGSANVAEVGSEVIVTEGTTSVNDPAKLDEKGVGFNVQFCGNAAKPFYGSGKTKGQWKRKQGVEQADYDAWYKASLAVAGQGHQEQRVDTNAAFNGQDQGQGDNVAQISTAAAFAGKQNGMVVNDGKNHQEQHQDGLTFADAGQFMQWLSEQQAANNITAGDIDSAYASTSCTMGDLFDPAKSANAIALVYNFLSNIAEGQ